MSKKALVIILISFLCGSIFIETSEGKEYPTKPIEILVPYGAGGTVDILMRLVADITPKYLGQPVIVINKPGAGASLAAAEIISSKPDGYKLITITQTFFTIATKTQKIPFDPGSLVPLVNLVEYKDGLFVRTDSPWKNLNELLEYARKNPRKLKWAHTARGTFQHLSGMLIFRKAGVETIDVPYPGGGAEMVAGLLGGHIDAGVTAYVALKSQIKAGKIKYLMLISDRRYSDLPDVPCATELGYPEVAKLAAYGGLYCHKDTPEDIRKTLTNVFRKVYENPEYRRKCEDLGTEPRFEGPEFMREAVRIGEEHTVPLLKELGLFVERK